MAENWLWSEIPVNKCDDERDGSGVMCVVTPLGQSLALLVLVRVPALEMRRMFVAERHRSIRIDSSAGAVVHHWNCSVSPRH